MSQSIVNKFADKEGISKRKSKMLIQSLFGIIAEEIATNGSSRIPGFGIFKVSKLSRKSIFNGRIYNVDAKVVRFSSFKKLKSLINKEA